MLSEACTGCGARGDRTYTSPRPNKGLAIIKKSLHSIHFVYVTKIYLLSFIDIYEKSLCTV